MSNRPRFPNNPLESGNFGDTDDSSDVLALLDRMRRNFELMNGSIDQEDASFQDAVLVANGTTLEITYSPDSSEKWLLLDFLSIEPRVDGIDLEIASGEESTDSNVFSPRIPKIVQDRLKSTITNTSGSQKRVDVNLQAREINKFEGGLN